MEKKVVELLEFFRKSEPSLIYEFIEHLKHSGRPGVLKFAALIENKPYLEV